MKKSDKKKIKKKEEQPQPAETLESKRLVVRLPWSLRGSLKVGSRAPGRDQLDWTPVRAVLDEWAESGDPIEVEPDPVEQVCFHVSPRTEEALREEADRLTEETGRRWTVSQVICTLWKQSQAT